MTFPKNLPVVSSHAAPLGHFYVILSRIERKYLEMGLANDAANFEMGPGNDAGASTDCVRQPGPKEVSTDCVRQARPEEVLLFVFSREGACI